jgi:hypothetical protein
MEASSSILQFEAVLPLRLDAKALDTDKTAKANTSAKVIVKNREVFILNVSPILVEEKQNNYPFFHLFSAKCSRQPGSITPNRLQIKLPETTDSFRLPVPVNFLSHLRVE